MAALDEFGLSRIGCAGGHGVPPLQSFGETS
jgi:hypothetical protein